MIESLNWHELLGYAASLFVGISLMMTSIGKLRLINLIGCLLFVAYGLLIGAYPVAVMNGFIALINLYHLAQMTKKEPHLAVEPARTIQNQI